MTNDVQNSNDSAPPSPETQHICAYGSTSGSCNGIHGVEKNEESINPGCSQVKTKVSSKADNEVQWTARKKLQVFLMALVNFVTFVAFSVLTPFFPNEALEMGASKTVIGFIFSVYPLIGFLLAPFAGVLIPKVGIRCVLMTGIFLAALGQIAFEFATMLPKGIIFITYCFGARILISFGGVLIDTSSFTFAAHEFPSHVATVLGILEVFTGLGFLVGPILGGVLYTYGGFKVPFIVGGGSMMLVGLPLYFLLPASTQGQGQSAGELFSSMLKCLKVPGVWIGVSAISAQIMAYSWMDPVVSPHLKHKVHMNTTYIGLLFGLMAFCYTIISPLAGRIVDKTAKHLLILCLGFTGEAIGILLLGPAPILTFLPRNTVWLTCVSYIIMGCSGGFGFLPGMPFMLQSVREYGLPDSLKLNAAISGIFGCGLNIGMFVGPSLSGALYEYTDFYWTTSVFAYILLFEILLLIAFGICTCKGGVQRKNSDEHKPLLQNEHGRRSPS